MSIFNTCIITTSSEEQSNLYRELIKKRIDHGLYPAQIQFYIFSDPPNKNIGSGGATILALKKLVESTGDQVQNQRVLIINAGGKYPNNPFFIPEGILFTPVPIDSSSVIPPVILDLHITLFLKYPWNNGEVVVIPADVIIDFEVFDIQENRGDICGFAVRAPLDIGSFHGVFKFDQYKSKIINYYQKADVDFLRRNAILEGTGECAVDTGILSLGGKAVAAFLNLVSLKTSDGTISDLINDGNLSFNLYLELITAALYGIDYESYVKRISEKSSLPSNYISLFYDTFNVFQLTAILTRSTLFCPLSNIESYLDACRELRRKDLRLFYSSEYQEMKVKDISDQIVFNSLNFSIPLGNHKLVVSESIQNCLIENVIGNNLLSGISNWKSDITIPEGICIDNRVTEFGDVKIVVGIDDTFKNEVNAANIFFCGRPLKSWLEIRKLSDSDIWEDEEERNLVNAKLFIPNSSDDFLTGYWANPLGDQWTVKFRSEKRYSINDLNALSNGIQRDLLRTSIRSKLLAAQIMEGKGWNGCSVNDFKLAFAIDPPIEKLYKFYNSTDDYLLKIYRKRLLEEITGNIQVPPEQEFQEKSSQTIDYISDNYDGIDFEKTITAQCPIRIDLAGGWTDMPPFTLRNGGAVVSFSADINGRSPIQVYCKKLREPVIRLISIDTGSWELINEFEQLRVDNGPEQFNLHKVILNEIGFFKHSGMPESSLVEYLKRIGFGIELVTFCPVPKGSGLGATSLLTSTILAVLYRLLGKNNDLKAHVKTINLIEQRMGMGGGWQDQLGGITGGLKYIESKPGLFADPLVYYLNSSYLEKNIELFTLYYTGISRPHSSVMIDVAARMSANLPYYNFTLQYMKQLAKEARIALETNNLVDLTGIINSGQKAANLIFPSQTQSFNEILQKGSPFYKAMKFTGAGGGYAIFISESLEKASILKELLLKSEDSRAAVVPFCLNDSGLEISIQ